MARIILTGLAPRSTQISQFLAEILHFEAKQKNKSNFGLFTNFSTPRSHKIANFRSKIEAYLLSKDTTYEINHVASHHYLPRSQDNKMKLRIFDLKTCRIFEILPDQWNYS